MWGEFRAGLTQARDLSQTAWVRRAGCQDLPARVAPRRNIPVNLSGLADRRATQEVDGGSASAVASWRRARCRAGTAVRRDHPPHCPLRGGGRELPCLWLLVGSLPQRLRA